MDEDNLDLLRALGEEHVPVTKIAKAIGIGNLDVTPKTKEAIAQDHQRAILYEAPAESSSGRTTELIVQPFTPPTEVVVLDAEPLNMDGVVLAGKRELASPQSQSAGTGKRRPRVDKDAKGKRAADEATVLQNQISLTQAFAAVAGSPDRWKAASPERATNKQTITPNGATPGSQETG